jgi:hypothetical protein
MTHIRSAAIYRGRRLDVAHPLHMDGGIGFQFPNLLNSRILRRLDGKRLLHAAAENGVTVLVLFDKEVFVVIAHNAHPVSIHAGASGPLRQHQPELSLHPCRSFLQTHSPNIYSLTGREPLRDAKTPVLWANGYSAGSHSLELRYHCG